MYRCAMGILVLSPTVLLAQPQPQPAPPAPPAVVSLEESVDVVAVTPLHGSGLPRLLIPANVQVITPDRGTDPTDLAAMLTRGVAPLQGSEVQGGTFQSDVLFRGFGGSPLLGASEGLAVYLDGVRANEPFGDIVNWDGLAPGAIASINVMPGSNPLFGLNALGGAVSVRTHDGFGARGARLSMGGGAFERYRSEGDIGGSRGRLAGFFSGSWLDEQGWRDESPSTLRRAFGKGSWRGGSTAVDMSVTVASNDLTGNGTAPERLLAERRSAVFTYPDRTDHDLTAFTARADREMTPTARLETMAYLRRAELGTLNGDAADDDDHDGADGDDAEDAPEYDAALNRSRTESRSGGMTAQLVWTRPSSRHANHAVVGVGFDAAASDFAFSSEYGWLSASREAIGAGVFDDDAAVGLDADTRTASVFLTDTFDVTARLHVTGAVRGNWTTVVLRDRLGVDLDGDHAFSRVNPSAGATLDVLPSLNVYGAWAQSSRVPTAVELTCADPEDPCRLPNAFVSDPPLEQPVAGTWEAGARGAAGRGSWSLSAFATRVTDDVIFVSSGTVRGSGHFENVSRTNRRGVEAAAEWRAGRVTVSGAYTWQQASYGTDLEVPSQFHPDARDTELQVREGDRLPGIPAHVGRLGVTARISAALDVGASWRGQSSQFLRGDEANLLAPVPAFSVVDARAQWRLGRRWSVLAQVINMFDAGYATFGMLGDASLLGEAYEDEPRFVSPGAPRAGWAGVEVRF
jgi:iron complex outermembrane recepter protein